MQPDAQRPDLALSFDMLAPKATAKSSAAASASTTTISSLNG